MKTSILLLTLGIVGVIANPVSKQTIQSENKNSVQTEISDSQTIQEEVINTANKGDQEQKKDKLVENTEPPNTTSDTNIKANADETVEIVIEESFDTLKDNLLEKCHHVQNTPVEIPKLNPDSNRDTDGTVEIIIEENHVGSIDKNPQQIFADDPLSPGLNENVPPMPGTFEIPQNPQFPELIGDSQPLPQFIEGPQVMDEFLGGPQYSGFIERSQLPGLFGGIPQMPGFIEGPQIPFNDNAQQPDDDENNIIAADYFSEDMEKTEHEIMETSAGFVPTPLVFRRKHKPRRRFTTRRHFRRNPYRRHQLFYPYYYAYYRPSSLRYY